MKKKILVILLVLLAFSLWSVLAIAKDKAAQKPTQVQKTEPNVGPEAFPKVMLPQAQPVRPTQEDFKREVLDKKGWTPEMLESWKSQRTEAGPEPAEKELVPALCTIANQKGPCCFRGVNRTPWLRCWGEVLVATYMNPEDSALGLAMCAQPIYPFIAKQVMMAIYNDDTCTLLFQPEIREALFDPSGVPYPGNVLFIGPVYNLHYTTLGTQQTYLSLVDSVCLYKPWFAVMHFLNTDDFDDSLYCPTGFPTYLSWIYDWSGRVGQSYWNPYGPGGSWYDVVLYAIESGAIRVRTRGYSKTENTCPMPPDPWYFKDSLALAPCGVPDFDQAQFPPAFCGPVAEANSYWWLNAKWGFDLTPMDPVALVNQIAAAAGTVPGVGTNCDQLEAAILQVIKAHGAWWFTETTVYKPDFWDLQKELKQCHDVTLLLGFWQFDGANWYRFGGHFVTMAGVDIFSTPPRFALSDPALDNAEANFPNPIFGVVCHADPFPHPGNPLIHNNPSNNSQDFYDVAWPSPSPGGYLYLPFYQANWPDFNGQNAGPFPNTGTYNVSFPVTVEIEQAIAVSPGPTRMSGTVNGSNIDEINNNMGGLDGMDVLFGINVVSPLFKGSIFIGTSQADLRGDYGSYFPTMTFTPLGPPVVDNFTVAGSAGVYEVQMLTVNFAHPDIAGLEIEMHAFGVMVPAGGTEDCEYVIEDVYVLSNTTHADITDLEKAMFLDYNIGGNADLVDYDQAHQSLWMYNLPDPDIVFGLTEVPAVKGVAPITGWGISNLDRIQGGQYEDSMKYWMENLGWGVDFQMAAGDMSILLADPAFDLAPEGLHINKYIKWGYNKAIEAGGDADWKHFLYNILHQFGYYRGDVNKDRKFNVADIVYLVRYLFMGGPKPIEFIDQGDLNNDGKVNVTDVISGMVSPLFKGGPFPIDHERFYEGAPIPANHKGMTIRESLFNDPAWKALGQ